MTKSSKVSKLTKTEVEHVAELSNLKLTPEEIKKLTPQLSKIIEFVATLSEVDTKNVEPTSQTTGLTNVLREDIVKIDESLTQEQALSGTDKIHNGYFKVTGTLSERSNE